MRVIRDLLCVQVGTKDLQLRDEEIVPYRCCLCRRPETKLWFDRTVEFPSRRIAICLSRSGSECIRQLEKRFRHSEERVLLTRMCDECRIPDACQHIL